ncbi:hypothetical protein [Cellvibrio polysaccharolyticus]|uniref:Uncharacterized protein n=1 Tax=Cellvibrio polysaccharolyticus TaxID=2082724 RepID=A0A928V5S7_9GAMM|nr:hypothetical protein [Cellvibrio polysaccharolyticus]MBE8717152.1 hypothetical protein [Cellvibrio polysaccharolyticus]
MLPALDRKDIDFAAPPIEFERATVTKSHGLWLAVVASCAMHFLLVLIIPLVSSPPVPRQTPLKTPPRTVHVTFSQVVPQKEVATIEVPDVSVSSPVIVNEPEVEANNVSSGSAVPEVASESHPVKTALSPAVTEPIADESNARSRRYRPSSSQQMSEISASQHSGSAYSHSSVIEKNVFHPKLRSQLKALQQQPALARVEDSRLDMYSTGIGSDRLKTKGGGCLEVADRGRDSGPRNWYMTRCAEKSESENMMDRVNEAVNERFNRSR